MGQIIKETVLFLIALLLLINVILISIVHLSNTDVENIYGIYKFDKTLSKNAYWLNISEAPTFIFLKDNYILDFGGGNYGVYSGIKYREGTVSDNEFSGIDISSYKNRKKFVITGKGNFTGPTIYIMDKEVWLSYYAHAKTPYIFRLNKIDVQK